MFLSIIYKFFVMVIYSASFVIVNELATLDQGLTKFRRKK